MLGRGAAAAPMSTTPSPRPRDEAVAAVARHAQCARRPVLVDATLGTGLLAHCATPPRVDSCHLNAKEIPPLPFSLPTVHGAEAGLEPATSNTRGGIGRVVWGRDLAPADPRCNAPEGITATVHL